MPNKKSRVKFTAEDEKTLIDFVKSNEILYNVHHKNYRDTKAKSRLWLKLAQNINKDVDTVTKKWKTIRDYYVRSKEKNTTGSAATSKREQVLSFLNQTSFLKRQTQTSVPSPTTDVDSNGYSIQNGEEIIADTQSNTSFVSSFDRGIVSDSNDILREFLENRPKPSNFVLEKNVDDIQYFCDSIAATLRKLSPLAVARIKIKIAGIVGEEEIAWAQQQT